MSPYSPDEWARLTELFGEALDLPEAERRSFLESQCVDNPGWISEVEKLIAAHEVAEADGRIEDGASDLAPEALDEAVRPADVGPYKLVREIGRGGMSTVWLAERSDGVYEQRVAVKLLKSGILHEDQLRRFRAERQILASLDHPNIARLIDGGVTETGQPYLVTEYIEGSSITSYCDTNDLDVDERLGIFSTVCEAVTFAHQNLVVHRDLKPSNIMVSKDGKVKLLDFGIAKLLEEDDGEGRGGSGDKTGTPMTRTGQIIMTPEYAAPEQVLGEVITTATDVYSLGMVLYELLSGVRPYAIEDRSPAALERVILKSMPSKPSVAVYGREATTDAAGKTTDTQRLARRLRGDLDTIVLKSIRKEPERRYGSAAELSADLQRYFDGLPVSAQPDTATYRIRKFVKRHSLGVAVAATFVLVLIAGLAATNWQAQIARTEAAKSQSVTDFLMNMLAAADPTGDEGRDVRVADLLDRAIDDLDTRFPDQPEVEAALRFTLGRVYTELGLYEEALALYQEAYAVRSELLGSSHRDAIAAEVFIGRVYVLQGEYDRADSVLSDAAARAELSLDPSDSLFIDVYSNLGYAAYVLGDYEASEAYHRATVAALERQSPPNELEIASSLGNVAIVLADLGDLEEASEIQRRQVEIYRQELGPTNARLGRALTNLGTVYFDLRMGDEAVEVLTEAVQILRTSQGDSNTETGWALGNLGSGLTLLDRDQEALNAFRESLTIYEESLGADHPRTASASLRLGRHLSNLGNPEEGEPYALRALKIWRETLPEGHPAIAQALSLLGDMELDQGSFKSAIPYLREAYEIRKESLPEDHPELAESATVLGFALGQKGNPADLREAEELLRSGYKIMLERDGADNEQTTEAKEILDTFCTRFPCESGG